MGLFDTNISHTAYGHVWSQNFVFPQALVASYISKEDYANVKDVTQFVLKVLTATVNLFIAFYNSEGGYHSSCSRLIFLYRLLLFQIGLVTGVSLAVILGFSFNSLAPVFTKDVEVLRVVRTGILVSKTSMQKKLVLLIIDNTPNLVSCNVAVCLCQPAYKCSGFYL